MNRWTALISVVALFFSGIAIGALAFVLLSRRGPGERPGPPPPRNFVERLDADLHLTAEQKNRIGQILDASRKESEAIRKEVAPRLMRQIQETREKIDAVLTPEQREKFASLRREHRGPAERFFLGEGAHDPWLGPPPPGPPPDAPLENR